MVKRDIKVDLTGIAKALVVVVLVSGCSPKGEGKAAKPEPIILKCEGVSVATSVVSAGGHSGPARTVQTSFRIKPDKRSVEIWRGGRFEPLCEKEKCLKSTKENFSVLYEEKGEPKSHFKEGTTRLDIDRITGRATYNFLKVYNDLITEVNFDGQCERSTAQAISRSKF